MSPTQSIKFDSVILAGGFGRRLAPITDTLPKPLLPICGESALVRNLKLLRNNGFMNTAVTTMYLPEMVEETRCEGGYIEYFRENEPLGSAGAVSAVKDRTEDCLLILSGDAVCDFDLKAAKEEFLKSGCDAAMFLYRSKDSGEYGSVCVENGRVTGLCEKPSVRDTLSDLINTGIYFLGKNALELIPKGEFFDFSRDLFPLLLKNKLPIAAIEPKGHWFDIGSFGEYHQCNMWVSRGENCIGQKVSVHPGARIESSVIFDNCTIGNSVIQNCIICENAVIGNDCMLPSGCVIGSGAELRDGCVLAPGTVIATGDTVKGVAPVEHFPRPKQGLVFDDDYIIAEEDDDGYFVRLGRLLGGEGTVIAFAEGGGLTLQQACETACGAAEAGSSCTVISGGTPNLAAFAAAEYGSRTAFISRAGEKTTVKLFATDGMPCSREELRTISSKVPKKALLGGSVYLLPHGALIKKYLEHLKNHTLIPKRMSVANGRENRYLREICEEFNVEPHRNGILFRLNADGSQASAITEDGREISYWQLLTLCYIEGRKRKVALPKDTPDAVEQILKRHGIEAEFYGDSDTEERKRAAKEFLHRDGILLALTATSIAEMLGTDLNLLLQKIPPFAVMTRAVFADKDRMTAVISLLRSENRNMRNAGFDFGDGRVSVFASASGRFRLVAEAVDAETAEEISLKAIDMLDKKKE